MLPRREDEADAVTCRVSHASPLTKARAGTRRGQTVRWKRPIGALTLAAESIEFP